MPEYSTIGDAASDVTEPADTSEQRVIQLNQAQHVRFAANKVHTGKYSVFTFVPRFLFEQFRKYANLFFLLISLFQQIPNVSPTGRWVTAIPLIIILAISAVKEIIEDIKRHRADNVVNNSPILVLRDGNWQTLCWKEVVVGDFVKVVSGNFFPADLILLSSSEPQGMCYIETANLDGETNLKLRQALSQTAKILSHQELMELGGTVECELPNSHLYEFTANIRPSGRSRLPVGADQLLLRGAMLRNTQWIFGVVVYTGHESKLMLNSTAAPLKRSNLDKATNFQIILLFGMLLALSLLSTILHTIWTSNNADEMWYLGLAKTEVAEFALSFLTFIILYNNLIPISLMVTIEIVKFMQAYFINWDLDMYYAETDTPALARTSNLNEELGQVKYVFTDKTGTLTRNVMLFRMATIGGRVYGDNEASKELEDFSDPTLFEHLQAGDTHSKTMLEFLTLLAVCHTVVPEMDKDGLVTYQASSPDEAALVKAAKSFGFEFFARTPESVTIRVRGEDQTYEILNVLEFTSDRKRMSVIVRSPEGQIKLYTKGADTVIYERLAMQQQWSDVTLEHLEKFAVTGLRTLCIAVAEISEEFYDEWKHTFYKASTSIQNRDKKLEEAAELIETNLVLLGATAIEDKLQDGVPQSIATLLKADIRVWVLTGDKQETAINVGYSCRLLTQGLPLVLINTHSLDRTREVISKQIENFGENLLKDNEVGLIVDGHTLKYALTPDCKHDFLNLARSCKAVICCRVSPLQKAELVELVKTNVSDAITLAIGDGANDVGMIQAAHVGIGISGLEGLQAVCASDYAIAQFRFLTKLLLVHGAWSYQRLCNVILYSFYKNICLYIIGFYFAFVNGFSGQIVFDRWCIGLYNVIFTAFQPLAMGLFDRYVSASTLLKFPVLYRDTQQATLFNTKVFWLWICGALYHAAILFWLPVMVFLPDIAFLDGKVGGLNFFGNIVYTYVVVTVSLKAGIETHAWTIVTHVTIWGSIVAWIVFLIIYSNVWPVFPVGENMVGLHRMILSSGGFWMGLLLLPAMALLADITYKAVKRTAWKSLREQIHEQEYAGKDPTTVILRATKKTLSETARLLRDVFVMKKPASMTQIGAPPVEMGEGFVTRGFAFSQEEHGVVPQSQLVRAYDTAIPKPKGS